MKQKVKIEVSQKRYAEILNLLQKIVERAPIDAYEVESCLLAEYYERHLRTFTFTEHKPGKKLHFTFQLSEGFALYNILGALSNENKIGTIALMVELQEQLPTSNP